MSQFYNPGDIHGGFMANSLEVFTGRAKTFQLVWRQGASSTSPPVDLTGATIAVRSWPLKTKPTITITDPSSGQCELTFTTASMEGASRGSNPLPLWLELTLPGGTEVSPDPIKVGVNIL